MNKCYFQWIECFVQVVLVDPRKDVLWKSIKDHIVTDEVHARDRLNANVETPGLFI